MLSSRNGSAGGDERLRYATEQGRVALDVLRKKKEATALAEAMPPLQLAIDEARKAKVDAETLAQSQNVLDELRSANGTLDQAYKVLVAAVRSTASIKKQSDLQKGEAKLAEAIHEATHAHVDKHVMKEAENRLRKLRDSIRKGATATAQLERATDFCLAQLRLFLEGASSQLKVIAIPELQRAIEGAEGLFVDTKVLERAQDACTKAVESRERAENASGWLTTASRASIKAMVHAAEAPTEASHILKVAMDSLSSALEGARQNGVDQRDVAAASELLESMTLARQRADERLGARG